MNVQEDEGSLTELAALLFDASNEPGEVVIQASEFEDVNNYFCFLCDLYLEGVKHHNNIHPEEPLPAVVMLRSTTAPFLAERMRSALRINPVLTPSTHPPLLPDVEFIWEPGTTVNECWLHSPVMGFSLQMKPHREHVNSCR